MKPTIDVRAGDHAARFRYAQGSSGNGYERLTSRERDVVAGLASGDTDRQIASRLGVSPRTVHKHLEHVYQQLGVATMTAAVVRVIDQLFGRVR